MRFPEGHALLWILLVLGASSGAGCDYEKCTDAFPNWQERQLTVEKMEEMSDIYGERPDIPGYCTGVPVGVDARNGKIVYVERFCQGCCPQDEYCDYDLAYGPDVGEAECRELGTCVVQNAESTMFWRCVPVPPNSYGFCY